MLQGPRMTQEDLKVAPPVIADGADLEQLSTAVLWRSSSSFNGTHARQALGISAQRKNTAASFFLIRECLLKKTTIIILIFTLLKLKYMIKLRSLMLVNE